MKSKYKKIFLVLVVLFVLSITVVGALAAPMTIVVNLAQDFQDECYSNEDPAPDSPDWEVQKLCNMNVTIRWDDVDISVLGNITDDEVTFGDTWIYVDSAARPDLDAHATIIFDHLQYVVEPILKRDGEACPECNTTFYQSQALLEIEVPGFSNYSLTGQSDFTVYADDEPYLQEKIYQVVDLGDARRNEEWACTVMIFARNGDGDWILAQTNPERKVQGKLFGDIDPNQPESLGYFPTSRGMVNTYFREDGLYGYMALQRVIQCSNNVTKLVREDAIDTRYFPAGRGLTGRLLWLTDGDNAFYLSFMIFGGLIVLWVALMVARKTFRR